MIINLIYLLVFLVFPVPFALNNYALGYDSTIRACLKVQSQVKTEMLLYSVDRLLFVDTGSNRNKYFTSSTDIFY